MVSLLTLAEHQAQLCPNYGSEKWQHLISFFASGC